VVVVLGVRALRRVGLGDRALTCGHRAAGPIGGVAVVVFGGITALFTTVYLVGLAKAGQEKPFA
jgi:hypothetical protein